MPAEIKALVVIVLAVVGLIIVAVVSSAVEDSIKASYGVSEVCK
jgi:hypothetical protein